MRALRAIFGSPEGRNFRLSYEAAWQRHSRLSNKIAIFCRNVLWASEHFEAFFAIVKCNLMFSTPNPNGRSCRQH